MILVKAPKTLLGFLIGEKSQGEVPMAIQSNHDDPWIHGNPEERIMILAVIIMIAMSPFVMWWVHG